VAAFTVSAPPMESVLAVVEMFAASVAAPVVLNPPGAVIVPGRRCRECTRVGHPTAPWP